MWQDLWVALSLVLVIEGIMPFVNPKGYRQAVMTMAQMGDRALRLTGFISMLLGALMVYWLKN